MIELSQFDQNKNHEFFVNGKNKINYQARSKSERNNNKRSDNFKYSCRNKQENL